MSSASGLYSHTLKATSKLCMWRESVLYLGDSLDPDMHCHNAVQCCISLRGTLRLRTSESENWVSCRAAVLNANVLHCIASPHGPLCILYLEKTSGSFRHILNYQVEEGGQNLGFRHTFSEKAPPTSLLEQLESAMCEELSEAQASELKRQCLSFFHGALPASVPLARSITRVLSHLHHNPGRNLSGSELAQRAGLSESRLQHLFKAQMGLPIRRYVLWTRLRYVVELAAGGATLTEAAHAAGFSDAPHFSRTFNAMFGIAPSVLFGRRHGMTALFCEGPDLHPARVTTASKRFPAKLTYGRSRYEGQAVHRRTDHWIPEGA